MHHDPSDGGRARDGRGSGRGPGRGEGGLVVGDAAKGPGPRLKAIFAEYWDDELRSDPLEATFVGDHRYDDRLPDPSEAAHAKRLARDQAHREALGAIDPAALSPDERIDREVLIAILDDRLEGERFRGHLIPITQQEGLHLKFAQSVNFHPAHTVGDLDNYVRRLRGFPGAVDATIALMKQGVAEGRVPPRITMAKVVPQLRALATSQPDESPLWGIAKRLPGDWSDADRRRVRDQVRDAIAAAVSPAFGRFADFVEHEYLPACRESVGLWDSPEGDVHYAYRARSFTTTSLSPDAIHEIGLAEMAKVREAMEANPPEGRLSGRPGGVPGRPPHQPPVQEQGRRRASWPATGRSWRRSTPSCPTCSAACRGPTTACARSSRTGPRPPPRAIITRRPRTGRGPASST